MRQKDMSGGTEKQPQIVNSIQRYDFWSVKKKITSKEKTQRASLLLSHKLQQNLGKDPKNNYTSFPENGYF